MSSPLIPLAAQAELTAALSTLRASPSLKSHLAHLHTLALSESPFPTTPPRHLALPLFVALDPAKCALVYQLVRATGARNVVEAGTSFGVSTVWLAMGVRQNGEEGKVVATEVEGTKAERARGYWRTAGEEIAGVIELREGDILETLKKDLGVVDFLLLDIWCALALPILKLVKSSLRPGAMIVADNTVFAKDGYAELMEYMETSGEFRMGTAPYAGGLMIAVYDPVQ